MNKNAGNRGTRLWGAEQFQAPSQGRLCARDHKQQKLQPHCPGIRKGTAKDTGTDTSRQAQLSAKREICPIKVNNLQCYGECRVT